MALSIALTVSKRLQVITLALLCIMASQLVVASCTPEPASYAARGIVIR